VLEW
jgi:hypothetical protein